MAMSTAGGGQSGPQMNVTPLIDVLLVLIIIFMLVVSQEKPAGEQALVPQPAPPGRNLTPERTIVIEVAWSGKGQTPALTINRQEVAWSDLHERLQRIFISRAERVAFVKGDDDIDFQYIADVIDIARNSGVEKVGLLGKDHSVRASLNRGHGF